MRRAVIITVSKTNMTEKELKQRIIANLHFAKGYFLLRGQLPEEKIEKGLKATAENLLNEFEIKLK